MKLKNMGTAFSGLVKELHEDKINSATVDTLRWTGIATWFPIMTVFLIWVIYLIQKNDTFVLVPKPYVFFAAFIIFFSLGICVLILHGKKISSPSWVLYILGFMSICDLFLLVHSTGGLRTSIFSVFYSDILAVSMIVSERAKRRKTVGRVGLVMMFTSICVFLSFILHIILEQSVQSIYIPVVCYASYHLYAILIIGLSAVIGASKAGEKVIFFLIIISFIILIITTTKI